MGRHGNGKGGDVGSPQMCGFRSMDVVWDKGAGRRWLQVYRAVSVAGYGC